MENEEYFFNCPHCNMKIVIAKKDINCAIFRHAVYKNTMEPINPHESEQNCKNLLSNNLVYGCAKPFRLIKNEKNEYNIVPCDYI